MASNSIFGKLPKNLAIMALSLTGFCIMLITTACTSTNNNYSSSSRAKTYTTYYPSVSSGPKAEAIGESVRIQGLHGNLATSKAGLALLEKYSGGGSHESVSDPVAFQGFVEPKPVASSSSFLRTSGGLTEKVLVTAYSQSGANYSTGGNSPDTGFDGPGFTRWVYKQNGIRIGSSVEDMASGGSPINRNDLRPGDLLIYRHPTQPNQYHMGIYSGSGNFIHAPKAGETVTESAAFGSQYDNLFVGARRYFNDPKAAPLSRQRKNEIASEAIKSALAQRPYTPAPKVRYVAKASSKKSARSKSSVKNSGKKNSSNAKAKAAPAKGSKSAGKAKRK